MPLPKAPTTVHYTSKYTDEVVSLVWDRYTNGRLALSFVEITGEPITTATVNLPERSLKEGETFIKSYSENEGMVETLVKLGIVEPTGQVIQSGYVVIPVCRWLVQP